jgi:hypothetical protein
MIRISPMLVSYLAAVIVVLAGPDQREQAIDTERSSLTVHVGKRACSPRLTNTGSMPRSQAESSTATAPSQPYGSLSTHAGCR